MATCCGQYGNSPVKVADNCYTWCDVAFESIGEGAFSKCLEGIAPFNGTGTVSCQGSQRNKGTPTTSSRPNPSPTTSTTTPPDKGAAVHTTRQSLGLTKILVSALLVGGLVSSGALLGLA
ncbi:uncharacterized protein K489DRAFT_380619 [Dissoconium aciculare CBS 342.82]|uniref:Uncharacterized protein n=1 Tax=Dissoconium aciculare CBS 342.82 TaxID=1314786 RepID=A0A6J3M8Q9_9PEZI|nr:uncharacterized protein K489DRAFT_380619 [Dissoconium aciculare CBS 342.82]KAF1823222.1 hypothetical protein K489DRAFT_380619 [Dissoconium aciculare CBS 342.82]